MPHIHTGACNTIHILCTEIFRSYTYITYWNSNKSVLLWLFNNHRRIWNDFRPIRVWADKCYWMTRIQILIRVFITCVINLCITFSIWIRLHKTAFRWQIVSFFFRVFRSTHEQMNRRLAKKEHAKNEIKKKTKHTFARKKCAEEKYVTMTYISSSESVWSSCRYFMSLWYLFSIETCDTICDNICSPRCWWI